MAQQKTQQCELEVIRLSKEDQRRFVEALLKPVEINSTMREAIKRYKAVQEGNASDPRS